jgi:hypothetical protein
MDPDGILNGLLKGRSRFVEVRLHYEQCAVAQFHFRSEVTGTGLTGGVGCLLQQLLRLREPAQNIRSLPADQECASSRLSPFGPGRRIAVAIQQQERQVDFPMGQKYVSLQDAKPPDGSDIPDTFRAHEGGVRFGKSEIEMLSAAKGDGIPEFFVKRPDFTPAPG